MRDQHHIMSLEDAVAQIDDPATAAVFGEALLCMRVGSNRAAVVLLWSAIVLDALRKMDTLRIGYQEPVASEILDLIETLQKENPKDSKWEHRLLNEIKQRTQLINDHELGALLAVQQERHVCAHPTLEEHGTLFCPTASVVRAHFDNALRFLLLKPPVGSRKMFDAMMEELEQRDSQLSTDELLANFLHRFYLGRMLPSTRIQAIASLWHVTFHSKDPRAEKNAYTNFRALTAVVGLYNEDCISAVNKRPDSFSRIPTDPQRMKLLCHLLSRAGALFQSLSTDVRAQIRAYCESKPRLVLQCSFISESLPAHFRMIEQRLKKGLSVSANERLVALEKQAADEGRVAELRELFIRCYTGSCSFDSAHSSFENLVKPILPTLDANQLERLAEGIKENDQTWGRRGALRHHSDIVAQMKELGMDDFDFVGHKLARAEDVEQNP